MKGKGNSFLLSQFSPSHLPFLFSAPNLLLILQPLTPTQDQQWRRKKQQQQRKEKETTQRSTTKKKEATQAVKQRFGLHPTAKAPGEKNRLKLNFSTSDSHSLSLSLNQICRNPILWGFGYYLKFWFGS